MLKKSDALLLRNTESLYQIAVLGIRTVIKIFPSQIKVMSLSDESHEKPKNLPERTFISQLTA
jgi:hypothetical protein